MRQAYIIAGPNGSGKTMLAIELVHDTKLPFLNADEIALKLAPDGDVRKVRLKAGKLFLKELYGHIKRGKSFVVETTLAGKYFVKVIESLKREQYSVQLIYLFVETAEEAINKIKLRVRKGGHSVEDSDVRRRFARSKANFWRIYKDMVDVWTIYFNVGDSFIIVAVGAGTRYNVIDEKTFKVFLEDIA